MTINTTIIGAGYVGAVAGACLSEIGNKVTIIDVDKKKINNLKKGIIPFYEPGLEDLIKNNIKNNRLQFTTNYEDALENSQICILAVGTPHDKELNQANLSFLYQALESVIINIKNDILLVNKSTVPLGTANKMKNYIRDKKQNNFKINIASNPEFLSQGNAVKNFLYPERIVVGIEKEEDQILLRKLYKKLIQKENDNKFIVTNIETAELIKYAANSFLAMKVSFINEIAQLANIIGADSNIVSKIIGMDSRIGNKFLNAGPGYGGSCFPKDTLALSKSAQEYNLDLPLISNINNSNEIRIKFIAQKIIELIEQNNIENIAILGTAFKANTDDYRDSQANKIIKYINENIKNKINIFYHDPMIKNISELNNIAKYEDSLSKITQKCNLICIATEWEEYKNFFADFKIGNKILLDLRNIVPQLKKSKNYYNL